MTNAEGNRRWAAALVGTVLITVAASSGSAQTYSRLYSFQCTPDGESPAVGVVRDSLGNVYGTTNLGGTFGQGTVFKLSPANTETVLHSFAGGPGDGSYPQGNLTLDGAGNLYGVTQSGGTFSNGAVFKVTSSGSETVLYSFTGSFDGGNPIGGLVRDAAGNLYGTTADGGGWS